MDRKRSAGIAQTPCAFDRGPARYTLNCLASPTLSLTHGQVDNGALA
jgi:hypothetical protein